MDHLLQGLNGVDAPANGWTMDRNTTTYCSTQIHGQVSLFKCHV